MFKLELEFNEVVVVMESLEALIATQKKWLTVMDEYDLAQGRSIAAGRIEQANVLMVKVVESLRRGSGNDE